MPLALALSPHLDDAAFSAGGTLAGLVASGWSVRLVTIFTATVPDPSGFAVACQTDKGLPPEADYMAIRRAEDFEAAAALGLNRRDVHHLPFPEAPHRGYGSAKALFAGLRDDDPLPPDKLAHAIAPLAADADLLLHPRGLGEHVDHLLLNRAIEALDPLSPRLPRLPRLLWQDTPYVLRLDPRPPADCVIGIDQTLEAKLNACAAYATQLGFQFGGEAAMRTLLRDLAAQVADGSPPTAAEAFTSRGHPADL